MEEGESGKCQRRRELNTADTTPAGGEPLERESRRRLSASPESQVLDRETVPPADALDNAPSVPRELIALLALSWAAPERCATGSERMTFVTAPAAAGVL